MPDVDRQPPKDPSALAKARQEGDARLEQTIQKNEQTFIDQLGPKPEPVPELPWVVRELSLDKDKALIEAHLRALSDDDRYLRFGASNLDVVITRVNSATSELFFGTFDPTGKTMVALGIAGYPVGRKIPSVEVGISVLPSHRKKGISRLTLQWALARARNRGVLLMEAQYYTENRGVRKLLESLGDPVDLNENEFIQLAEMSLPEPDAASHRLEATHRKLSDAWPKS